jgi:indole-3-glycerol phosphate synthase
LPRLCETEMDILQEIFDHKKREVSDRMRLVPLAQIRRQAEEASRPVDFLKALGKESTIPALIAEVKFHSPSKGELVKKRDPVGLASLYTQYGAAAISVLTDEKYFHGQMSFLQDIQAVLPHMPLLRKDFIFDPYQVYESRAGGASSMLLIAASLEGSLLMNLHELACSLGLTPLVEVHNRTELETVLRIPNLKLVGVNNRDLHTFQVNLDTCLDLRPLVPEGVGFVAESGIHRREDVLRLADHGVHAVLVGEALVTAPEPGRKICELFGRPYPISEAA